MSFLSTIDVSEPAFKKPCDINKKAINEAMKFTIDFFINDYKSLVYDYKTQSKELKLSTMLEF